VGAEHTFDPGALAERRAHRIIDGQDRRRAVLRSAPPLLKVSAFVAAIACGCSILYGWGAGLAVPLALLVVAVVLAGLARGAERAAPPALTGRDRAQLTVREAWRAVRADADETAAYPRHAIWAAEAGDGTVQLWRLTRAAGADAIAATLVGELDARDTVVAAEALAEAREAAREDEEAAMEQGLQRDLDAEKLAELHVEAAGLARALRAQS
jgi:hypothetical protein